MSLETECTILKNIPMFQEVDVAKLRLLAMSAHASIEHPDSFVRGTAGVRDYLDGVFERTRSAGSDRGRRPRAISPFVLLPRTTSRFR